MKHLIIPASCILMALLFFTVSLSGHYLPTTEISKAMAVVLLLIAIKQLQQHA